MISAKSFGTTDYSGYLLTLPQANRYSNIADKTLDFTSMTANCTSTVYHKPPACFKLLSNILSAFFTGSFTTTLTACSIHP